MQFISAHHGKLQTLSEVQDVRQSSARPFITGLDALDALAPGQSFARGAVHELLFRPGDGEPKFAATILAQGAAGKSLDVGRSKLNVGSSSFQNMNVEHPTSNVELRTQSIIWSDPHRQLYPPALAALGFDLSKLYLLRPDSPADESWAITECLRCRGVGAVVASLSRMTRIEARRYQLAAESGGGVGIFLRPLGRSDNIYAAATRWLVAPCPGERTIQRWTIQLLHGHGGRVGQTVFLEWSRGYNGENNSVRAIEKLPRRSVAPTVAQERAIA